VLISSFGAKRAASKGPHSTTRKERTTARTKTAEVLNNSGQQMCCSKMQKSKNGLAKLVGDLG
jgi:hypothetical protein